MDGQSRTFTYNVTVFDPSSSNPGPITTTRLAPPRRPRTAHRTTLGATPVRPRRHPHTDHDSRRLRDRRKLPIDGQCQLAQRTRHLLHVYAVVPSGTAGSVTGTPVRPTDTRSIRSRFRATALVGLQVNISPVSQPLRQPVHPPPPRLQPALPPRRPPTPTRTATAVSQATATRPPGGFVTGDTVRTNATVNLRSGPSTSSSVVTVIPSNTNGTITGASVVSGSNTFYPDHALGIRLRLDCRSIPDARRRQRPHRRLRPAAIRSARPSIRPPISTSALVPVPGYSSAALRPGGRARRSQAPPS